MKKKGFTLVELLVVIAILAILATVSIVGYTQFIAKSRQSVCLQEATQVRDLLIAEDINNNYFTIDKDGNIQLEKCDAPHAEESTTCTRHSGKTTNDGHYFSWADKEVASNEFKKDLGNLRANVKVVEGTDGKATFYYVTEGYYATINFTKDIEVKEVKSNVPDLTNKIELTLSE